MKEVRWSKFRRKAAPYVFVSPFFITFLVFSAFPIIFTLVLSVHSWNGIREMKFIGLNNFIFLFKDPIFWKTLANTIIMLILGAIPGNMFAIFFAFVLNQAFIKLKNTFKTIFFMPYITSTVAIALIFAVFYGTQYGFLNYIMRQVAVVLKAIGIDLKMPIEWLKGPLTLFSIAFVSIWKWTGWNALLYLAGMQGINETIYEAAKIDGASMPQIFFRITLPMLRPIIFFVVTMSIIGGMQTFDDPVVLLGVDGGPANAYMGVTSSMYIYSNAFRWGYFGVSAAASCVLFLIIIFMSWLNKKLFAEKE